MQGVSGMELGGSGGRLPNSRPTLNIKEAENLGEEAQAAGSFPDAPDAAAQFRRRGQEREARRSQRSEDEENFEHGGTVRRTGRAKLHKGEVIQGKVVPETGTYPVKRGQEIIPANASHATSDPFEHFEHSSVHHPLGRGIPKSLAKQLGCLPLEE